LNENLGIISKSKNS